MLRSRVCGPHALAVPCQQPGSRGQNLLGSWFLQSACMRRSAGSHGHFLDQPPVPPSFASSCQTSRGAFPSISLVKQRCPRHGSMTLICTGRRQGPWETMLLYGTRTSSPARLQQPRETARSEHCGWTLTDKAKPGILVRESITLLALR